MTQAPRGVVICAILQSGLGVEGGSSTTWRRSKGTTSNFSRLSDQPAASPPWLRSDPESGPTVPGSGPARSCCSSGQSCGLDSVR